MRHRLAGPEEADGWVDGRIDLAIRGERDRKRSLSEIPGRAVRVIAREGNGSRPELERWSLLRQCWWRGYGDGGRVLARIGRCLSPPVVQRHGGGGVGVVGLHVPGRVPLHVGVAPV